MHLQHFLRFVRIKFEVIEQSPALDALKLFIDGISLGTRHYKVGQPTMQAHDNVTS